VILGLAVLTRTAFDGAYFQMIAHGVTSAMMFFIVGVVYERAHHRDIDRLGGIWLRFPGLGFWSIVGFFAAMGLPGLCGFVGEVMVLLGTFAAGAKEQVSATMPMRAISLGALAAVSVVLTAGYVLWMFQRVYMGPEHPQYVHFRAISVREYVILGVLGVMAVVLGVAPVLVFDATGGTVDTLFEIFKSTAKVMASGGV
jgi:NADH-quinone oxidoreductase subunit M